MALNQLAPYVQHIGNCGAVGSTDPMDYRCICGLRQLWLKLIDTQTQGKVIPLRGM